jgi:hypothetical protein
MQARMPAVPSGDQFSSNLICRLSALNKICQTGIDGFCHFARLTGLRSVRLKLLDQNALAADSE